MLARRRYDCVSLLFRAFCALVALVFDIFGGWVAS